MIHHMDLTKTKKLKLTSLSDKFRGKDEVHGKELSFTNYYMQIDGKPFLGVSGECHYARVQENQWEDTIRKMKMGGINIVSTYVFWIHHEEEERRFRFDGNRNIRKFVELCKKHGMYVIVRIGPFCHGEVRNGGLPDWLYGKPFEVRSVNEGFLACTRRLYRAIAEQLSGLYFKDGGPIIAAQIENEYMHSSAPWEIATGISNEWIPGGSEGDAYMIALKKIAQEEGILTPFYTCTGWGGAAAPSEEMLTLWGGYAFWPWIFYDYRGEHPATPEYLYRDNHNNEVPQTYNFDPTYEPESFPYACCEMGGGMSCFYHYRFQFPHESVDAMANIKLASGCNFLGYYMYRGGSNPRGEKTPFLNEFQCPKISYDYQAAIGEYGQLRPSYYRLKVLHQFLANYKEAFCNLVTVLPEGSQEIAPEDAETLRYAVRTDGERGFLFLNNYQDHVICQDKKEETICLETFGQKIVIPNISLAAGEEAILPFGLDVGGYRLLYAKAQPLSIVKNENETVYFFFSPSGMEPEYVWDSKDMLITEINGMSEFEINGKHGKVRIVTLTREQSLQFYEIEIKGQKHAVLCDGPITFDGEKFLIENSDESRTETTLMVYPELNLRSEVKGIMTEYTSHGIWSGLKIAWENDTIKATDLSVNKVGSGRYTIELPAETECCKDRMLQIHYRGDVGHLFSNGIMISDNFSNGAVWEVGLHEALDSRDVKLLTLVITPKKEKATVNVSSTMAGRVEEVEIAVEKLESIRIKPVREIEVLY